MKTSPFNGGKKVITNTRHFILEAPAGVLPDIEILEVSLSSEDPFSPLRSIIGDLLSGRRRKAKKKAILVQNVCDICAEVLPQRYKDLSRGQTLSERNFQRFTQSILPMTRHSAGVIDQGDIAESYVAIGEKIGPFTGLFAESAVLLKDEEGTVWIKTPAGRILPISESSVKAKLREVDGTEVKLEDIPLTTRAEIIALLAEDKIGLPDFPEGVFKVAA